MTQKLILGSGSPRRSEILSYFHVPFSVAISSFDEESVPFNGDPEAYVREISLGKACALEADCPILTADTTVFCEGRVLGKPQDEDEAISHLNHLSGKWHTVYTAVCLKAEETEVGVCATRVFITPLTNSQIAAYLQAFSTMDKAGGYAIQKGGALIVEKIEGCYYNVMGLPIHTTKQLLNQAGIDIWESIKPLL